MKTESFSSCFGAKDSDTEMQHKVAASQRSRIERRDRQEELLVQLLEESSPSCRAEAS